MSPSGITSMKVRSKPRPCAHFIRPRASSSLKPFSATVLILTLSPAAAAASRPARTTLQIAPARHLAKLVRIERVERDVDPPDAAIGEFGGKAGELRAVGGDRHFIERSSAQMAGKPAEQRHYVAPDQRLAAGDANLARPEADECRAQPVELFERQNVPLGQEIHVLGHAVDAAIIAPVCDRNSHVGDRATERVDERPSDHWRVSVHRPNHIDTRWPERKAPSHGQRKALLQPRCIQIVITTARRPCPPTGIDLALTPLLLADRQT